MGLKSLLTGAFFIGLLGAVGFGWIAIWIGDHRIARFDESIVSMIHMTISAPVTRIMFFFTYIGSGLPVAVIASVMLILLAWLKYRRELLFFIGVISGSALLNVLLKIIFHRARPTVNRIINANGYSFPSGHSMGAFTLYGVLIFLLWKHVPQLKTRIILLAAGALIILAIGISRIYLGVHYPSDVVGGYLASGTWLTASIGLYRHYFVKRIQKSATNA